jgi:N-acetylglutamate synthase-like GNAT family acetyltransferase
MIIRSIEISDVARCQEIVRANWDEAAARRFTAEVSQVWALDMEHPPQFFVAEQPIDFGYSIVGFAGMARSMLMQGVWDFTFLAVDPGVHGMGVGFALVEHRIKEVFNQGGSAIHLMTQKPGYFKQWGFQNLREYAGEGWCLMSHQIDGVKL